LIEAIPDFVAFLRRDGAVLRHLGGRRLFPGHDARALAGQSLFALWPEPAAAQLRQGLRHAIASRGSAEVFFVIEGRRHEAQFTARGPDRALCVIREPSRPPADPAREGVRGGDGSRREFFARLRVLASDCVLRERSLAVCVVHLDGIGEIGRIIDYSVSRQVNAALLQRLSADAAASCAGRLGESLLAIAVSGFPDREALTAIVASHLAQLAAPVQVGDATFSVSPSIGIALLGDDGDGPKPLLEHAEAAMLEARRGAGAKLYFYTPALRERSLARLDLERELRDALAADELSLRYVRRGDLDTGRVSALCAYLQWPNALGRDLRAADFLPIAESSGLALQLSRWALRRLRQDLPALGLDPASGLRISFGPLRQHLSSDDFGVDVADWLDSGEIDAGALELRVAEKALAGLPAPGRLLRPFAERGVSLVVDEFGRGYTSLPRLARLPFRGLQIDRALALASRQDPVALRATRAAAGVAAALGLVPIAAGVDDEADRERLRSAGCTEGLGDWLGEASRAAPAALGHRARA